MLVRAGVAEGRPKEVGVYFRDTTALPPYHRTASPLATWAPRHLATLAASPPRLPPSFYLKNDKFYHFTPFHPTDEVLSMTPEQQEVGQALVEMITQYVYQIRLYPFIKFYPSICPYM